jgi:hypothetical protein
MAQDKPVGAGAEDAGEGDEGGVGRKGEVGFEEVRDAGCHSFCFYFIFLLLL